MGRYFCRRDRHYCYLPYCLCKKFVKNLRKWTLSWRFFYLQISSTSRSFKGKFKSYGNGLYHGDSSICKSALHQGVLKENSKVTVMDFIMEILLFANQLYIKEF